MRLTVLERTFSPTFTTAMTDNRWMEVNEKLDSCLETRDVQWLYSLVSAGGDRSICLFQVPYTEAVRESCREARMPFQRVWQAEQWSDCDLASFSPEHSLVVAEVNYGPPMTQAVYAENKRQAEGCFQELNIQHLLSFATLDGTHSVCLFLAGNAEDVRSLYRKFESPFERVWKAILIQPSHNFSAG